MCALQSPLALRSKRNPSPSRRHSRPCRDGLNRRMLHEKVDFGPTLRPAGLDGLPVESDVQGMEFCAGRAGRFGSSALSVAMTRAPSRHECQRRGDGLFLPPAAVNTQSEPANALPTCALLTDMLVAAG